MGTKDIETVKKELLARRSAIIERLEKIKNDKRRKNAGPLSADFEEQATELENVEVLDGIERAQRAELAEIELKLSDLGFRP